MGTALGRAGGMPFGQQHDLFVSQAPLIEEFLMARFRQPRRHNTRLSHFGNLRGTSLGIGICQQTKRCCSARVMTVRAVGIEDWCDVAVEGDDRL